MLHKRNRTIEEKIIDCLDNSVKNLHPSLRETIFDELKISNIGSVSEMTKYVLGVIPYIYLLNVT